MRRSKIKTRTMMALAILVTGVSVAATATAATAASAASQPKQPSVTAARAQLRSGALSSSAYGVTDICAAHKLRCNAKVLTRTKSSAKPLVFEQPVGYGATELERAYGLAKASTTTATIAVIEAGAYPNLESDLEIYRATYGLPRCSIANGCLRIKNYLGGPALQPTRDPFLQSVEEDSAVETALDVQMASAACPRCHILEVQVPIGDGAPQSQRDLDAAVKHFAVGTDTAARLGAKAVSISYGYPTDDYTDTASPARDMNLRGTAIFAASGDDGLYGDLAAWPSNLPTVTQVGGTSLYHSSGSRGYTDVAWAGSGSGCAYDLPHAVGQPYSVAKACDGQRTGSDISAIADPYTGVAVYDSYAPASGYPLGFVTMGGTSAATPFVAGIAARAGVPSTVSGPNTIYAAKSSTFNDVTLGANAVPGTCASYGVDDRLCNAGYGWDGPTGRGTPKGLAPFK